MHDENAVIQPSIDIRQIARDIQRAHTDLQDVERKLKATEAKATALRETRQQLTLELGGMLCAAKRELPPAAWGGYIERLGISGDDASAWMQLRLDIATPTAPVAVANDERPRDDFAEARAEAAAAPVADRPDVPRQEVVYQGGSLRRSQVQVLVHALFVLEREGDPKSQAAAHVIRQAFGLEP